MKNKLPHCLVLSMLLFSLSTCLDTLDLESNQQNPIMAINEVPLKEGAVNFLNLKAGQKSTYLRGEILSSINGLPHM